MQQVLWRIPIPWTDIRIPIYGFGMMLFLAFILCTWLASRRARRVGIAPEQIQDLVIWLFVGGLLGARTCHLLFEQKPQGLVWFLQQLPQIWNGGIVFYGSVVGGLAGYLGAWWFIFRKHRTSTRALADVLAPSIALGLCLGRIGCLLNGCCYGQVACADCAVYPILHFPLSAPAGSTLVHTGVQTAAGFTFDPDQPTEGVRVGRVVPDSPAWNAGLRPGDVIVRANDHPITTAQDLSGYLNDPDQWRGQAKLALTVKHEGKETDLQPFTPRTVGLYPTQLYESVSMFLLLLLLLAYEPFRRRDGQIMALLMVGYGIHRFLNEMLRDDPRPEGFESYTSVVLVAAGLALWLWLQLKPAAKEMEPPKAELAPAC